MITIEQALDCKTWKTCSKCGDEKKTIFFSKRRNGYRSSCKQCDALAYKAKKARLVKQVESKSLWTRIKQWLSV